MKRILLFIITVLFIFSFFSQTYADNSPSYTILTINQNGSPVNISVYGYYTTTNDGQKIFVVCDPTTNKEVTTTDPKTGQIEYEAYIPGGTVQKQTQELVGYNNQKQLDLNTLVEVKPAQITIFAPNVPTSIGWEEQPDGSYIRVIGSTYTFPSTLPKNIYLQGNFPDYGLVVAQITNPNPFPISAGGNINVLGKSSNFSVSLGANETKYYLVDNGGSRFNVSDANFMQTYINSGIDPNNMPPNYPDFLKPMLFTLYSIQNYYDNTWTLYPSYPFGLCYYFHGFGGYQDEVEVTGHVIYNFDTKRWSIYASSGNPSCPWYLYADVSGVVNQFDTWILNKFNNDWGFYPPFVNTYEQRIYDEGFVIVGLWPDVYPGSKAPDAGIGGLPGAWKAGRANSYYTIADYNHQNYNGDLNSLFNIPSGYTDINEDMPMRIDQYKFIPINGNIGYLQKYSMNGLFKYENKKIWYYDSNGNLQFYWGQIQVVQSLQ